MPMVDSRRADKGLVTSHNRDDIPAFNRGPN